LGEAVGPASLAESILVVRGGDEGKVPREER
jgi:hypothetical protein